MSPGAHNLRFVDAAVDRTGLYTVPWVTRQEKLTVLLTRAVATIIAEFFPFPRQSIQFVWVGSAKHWKATDVQNEGRY